MFELICFVVFTSAAYLTLSIAFGSDQRGDRH